MGVAGFRSAAERASADGGPGACSFVPLHATPRKPMRQLLKNTFTLALALVFTAGMAFGQDVNEATVDQDGSGSDADITQDINGADGSSFDANVRQRGGSQTVTINQLASNSSDNGSGIADVIQLGADGGNEALVDQNRTRGAKAFLKQVGADNEATAAQGAEDVLR